MLLTIGVITYERPAFLDKLLSTILESGVIDAEKVELIILDNGSGEYTKNILIDWSRKLPFTLLRNDQNRRGGFAYRKILEKAKGDWLIFPGDDDQFIPGGIKKVISECEAASEGTSIIPFGAKTIDSLGEPTPIVFRPKTFNSSIDFFATAFFESPFWMPATAIKRSLVSSEQIPRSLTVVDWWLWINGGLKGEIKASLEPVLEYRIHDGQEQKSYLEESWQLDRAISFTIDITSGSIGEYLAKINSKEFQELVQKLTIRVIKLEPNFVDKYLLIVLIRQMSIYRPDETHSLRNLLINAGVDLRFSATILESAPSIEDYMKFLKTFENKNLLRLEGTLDHVGSINEIESILTSLLGDIRQIERDQTLTPFEKKIIRIYRGIRFNPKVRWLIGK
jgi:glycosyltransferase involved in cell wall biosynthesis